MSRTALDDPGRGNQRIAARTARTLAPGLGMIVGVPSAAFRMQYAHAKRFREVAPGRFYRSGQMTAAGFRDMIRRYPLQRLASAGEVYFDFSMVEGVGAVARLMQNVTPERVLFGSNYPLFYFESALLKVQESGLTEAQKKVIFEDNARRLLSSP